jgi:hypothetical protein
MAPDSTSSSVCTPPVVIPPCWEEEPVAAGLPVPVVVDPLFAWVVPVLP